MSEMQFFKCKNFLYNLLSSCIVILSINLRSVHKTINNLNKSVESAMFLLRRITINMKQQKESIRIWTMVNNLLASFKLLQVVTNY